MKAGTLFRISIFFICLLLIGIYGCEKKESTNVQADLKIESYYPNSGNSGTLVTIIGEGFGTVLTEYKVMVLGKAAEVISATTKRLVVRIPEGTGTGKIEITYQGKAIDVGAYTYQSLSVQAVFPANGPAGSQIRISGAGFGSVSNPAEVFVNTKKALVVSVSDTLIIAEVPAESGTGDVMVKVDGKEAKGQKFVYQAIHSIKPLSGGSGTRVTITGEGFETLAVNNSVEFNGKPAVILEANEGQLVVRAPEEVKTGPLVVSIHNQKTIGPNFTVVGKPIIDRVTPLSGPKGSEMTIEGELFSEDLSENQVYINNVLIPLSGGNGTQLKLTIPGGTGSGTVRVVVNDQTTIGPQFKDQNLGILTMTPDNGIKGTTVTLKGTGFSPILSENKVYFNGVLAPLKSATENTIVLDAPEGLRTGVVRIVVGEVEAFSAKPFQHAGVITLAGGPGTDVFGNLQGGGIAVDSKGNVYVGSLNRIHKITAQGDVSVFVGALEAGAVDGQGAEARFSNISGLAMDNDDNLYVADRFNSRIRMVTPNREVSTVARISFTPIAIAADKEGNIYVGQTYNGAFLLNKRTGVLTKLGQSMYETGDYIAPISPTEIYYAPSGTDYLKAFAMINNVKSTYFGTGNWSITDGPAQAASTRGITGMLMTADRVMYFMDNGSVLRKVEKGIVTTLTNPQGNAGYVNGGFQQAQFSGVNNMCMDKEGNIYVVEQNNRAIRKIFFN